MQPDKRACGRAQDQGNHAQSKARSDAKLAELNGSDIFGGAQQVCHEALRMGRALAVLCSPECQLARCCAKQHLMPG